MKYAATPRPSTLRALAGTECELTELALEGYRSLAQEELEDAYLEARIARWERERIEQEIEVCYGLCTCGSYYCSYADVPMDDYDDTDWDEEDRLWEQEMREMDHAYAVMHLARTIVRNPVLHP